jgi:hypothetical protein
MSTQTLERFVAATDPAAEIASKHARFSPLEWSVIALARRDTLSSLDRPGRLAMALGTIFGGRRNPQLADPRLEALRRFAVMLRHLRDRLPDRELVRFIKAGFTRGHATLLRLALVPSPR